MPLTTESSRTFEYLPNFTSEQRRIARVSEFETQFIPRINLPVKGTITLDNNSIDFRLLYDVGSDESTTMSRFKNVSIEFGVRTQRIFRLKAQFGEASYRMLAKRVEDINSAIAELEKTVIGDTKKNYQLIQILVRSIFDSINQKRDEIEKDLFPQLSHPDINRQNVG